MKRIHNTSTEMIEFNKFYSQKETDFKPRGLWYSTDYEWLEWCQDNMPHWVKEYIFELDINTSEILIIKTRKELESFITIYQEPFHQIIAGVNWENVKRDYKGIEILNYHSLKWRMNSHIFHTWFYGWDVSGGCIWNLSVINNVTKYLTPKEYIIEVET